MSKWEDILRSIGVIVGVGILWYLWGFSGPGPDIFRVLFGGW